MRKPILFISIFLCTYQLMAFRPDGDTSWKSKYEASLGFSQTSFTNWSAGGENALALNGMLNVYKMYAKDNVFWTNYLGLAYGVNIQQTEPKVRKTNDKINFLTKGGFHAWKNWDYAGLFEFKSQFDQGFNYPNDSVYISRFMAPGYFQLSLGLNYKPVEYFAVFISPIGARLTVVNDTTLTNSKDEKGNLIGAFGVIGDNTSLWQIGGSINAVFKKDIMKNVNFMSKLDLFSDYLHNPQNIIVGWENNLLMKVNKYISLSFTSMLIYDDNINYTDKEGNTHGPRTQFRETFALGFSYSLEHK
ncbi:MAG: DUF3078 domain-containing protein [Bacteroidota bacterium]